MYNFCRAKTFFKNKFHQIVCLFFGNRIHLTCATETISVYTNIGKITNSSIASVIRFRFMDQVDADEEAEKFLVSAMQVNKNGNFSPSKFRLRWWNLEGDDGRCGTISYGNEVVATVTITRDDWNWSEVCGVSFHC